MSQKRRKKGRQQRRQAELTAAVTPMPAAIVSTVTDALPGPRSAEQPTGDSINTTDVALMRRDLGKVVLVVGVVIASLIVMVLTNRSSGWIDRIASELYRWLRLG